MIYLLISANVPQAYCSLFGEYNGAGANDCEGQTYASKGVINSGNDFIRRIISSSITK